jgi:predicted MPP superfamily phosphohydrolase
MRRLRLSRRAWFRLVGYGLPVGAALDAFALEPAWLTVRRLRPGPSPPTCRFVHFTDLHHKGDRDWLERVVHAINRLAPEFVCFGGDLVEDSVHLEGALAGLRGLQAPLFGVPGNHDYWSNADFAKIGQAFAATGGRWLLDEAAPVAGGKVQILGYTCRQPAALAPRAGVKNVALIHYPAWFRDLGEHRFDLILAGHSHGGQVRLPFVGALVEPFGVDGYDLGLYPTTAGPLYVGAGIGWFYLNVRFRCRPEITLVEL